MDQTGFDRTDAYLSQQYALQGSTEDKLADLDAHRQQLEAMGVDYDHARAGLMQQAPAQERTDFARKTREKVISEFRQQTPAEDPEDFFHTHTVPKQLSTFLPSNVQAAMKQIQSNAPGTGAPDESGLNKAAIDKEVQRLTAQHFPAVDKVTQAYLGGTGDQYAGMYKIFENDPASAAASFMQNRQDLLKKKVNLDVAFNELARHFGMTPEEFQAAGQDKATTLRQDRTPVDQLSNITPTETPAEKAMRLINQNMPANTSQPQVRVKNAGDILLNQAVAQPAEQQPVMQAREATVGERISEVVPDWLKEIAGRTGAVISGASDEYETLTGQKLLRLGLDKLFNAVTGKTIPRDATDEEKSAEYLQRAQQESDPVMKRLFENEAARLNQYAGEKSLGRIGVNLAAMHGTGALGEAVSEIPTIANAISKLPAGLARIAPSVVKDVIMGVTPAIPREVTAIAEDKEDVSEAAKNLAYETAQWALAGGLAPPGSSTVRRALAFAGPTAAIELARTGKIDPATLATNYALPFLGEAVPRLKAFAQGERYIDPADQPLEMRGLRSGNVVKLTEKAGPNLEGQLAFVTNVSPDEITVETTTDKPQSLVLANTEVGEKFTPIKLADFASPEDAARDLSKLSGQELQEELNRLMPLSRPEAEPAVSPAAGTQPFFPFAVGDIIRHPMIRDGKPQRITAVTPDGQMTIVNEAGKGFTLKPSPKAYNKFTILNPEQAAGNVPAEAPARNVSIGDAVLIKRRFPRELRGKTGTVEEIQPEGVVVNIDDQKKFLDYRNFDKGYVTVVPETEASQEAKPAVSPAAGTQPFFPFAVGDIIQHPMIRDGKPQRITAVTPDGQMTIVNEAGKGFTLKPSPKAYNEFTILNPEQAAGNVPAETPQEAKPAVSPAIRPIRRSNAYGAGGADGSTDDLIRYIRKTGGVNLGTDLHGEMLQLREDLRQPGIFNKNGLPWDDMETQMKEEGFLGEHDSLMDALRKAARGEKVYGMNYNYEKKLDDSADRLVEHETLLNERRMQDELIASKNLFENKEWTTLWDKIHEQNFTQEDADTFYKTGQQLGISNAGLDEILDSAKREHFANSEDPEDPLDTFEATSTRHAAGTVEGESAAGTQPEFPFAVGDIVQHPMIRDGEPQRVTAVTPDGQMTIVNKTGKEFTLKPSPKAYNEFTILDPEQAKSPSSLEEGGPGAASIHDSAFGSRLAALTQNIRDEIPPQMPITDRLKTTVQMAIGDVKREASDTVGQISDFIAKAKAIGSTLFHSLVNVPEYDGIKPYVGRWDLALQTAARHSLEFVRGILRAVPDPLKREGITNYIQADGDRGVLQQRLQASLDNPKAEKFAAGYEAALNLLPHERVIANHIADYYYQMYQEGTDVGLIKSFVENYVNQGWKKPNEISRLLAFDFGSSTLQPNFKYARKRIFDSYFEGEQKGLDPKTKDIAQLVAMYDRAFHVATAARAFIAGMIAPKAVMPDGLPMLARPVGGGQIVEKPDGSSILFIQPGRLKTTRKDPVTGKTVPIDTTSYQPVPHFALKDWYFATTAPDGTPVIQKSDLYVHPDALRSFIPGVGKVPNLRNILGNSMLRRNPLTKALLNVQSISKQTMMSASFFHPTQIGLHAVGHFINPFQGPPEGHIDMTDPFVRLLASHGAQLASDPYDQFAASEGLFSGGSLLNKLPIVGKQIIQPMNAWLFQDYIPWLKVQLGKAAYDRNVKRYGNKYNNDQILEMTANQINAAFGEQNYRYLGRNKTLQDTLRLILLAPDFLESRAKFVGQSFKAGGGEARMGLATLAIGQYLAARILNKVFDDDYHFEPDMMFSVKIGKDRYSLRSIASDMLKLGLQPRQFLYDRLSPIIGRGTLEAVTGRDYAGRPMDAGGQLLDFAKSFAPISLGIGREQSLPEKIGQAVGIHARKYKTPGEQAISEALIEGRPGTLDPAELEAYKLKGILKEQIRSGADIANSPEFADAKQKFSRVQLQKILRQSQEADYAAGFRSLSALKAAGIWDKLGDKEKEILINIYMNKLSKALNPGSPTYIPEAAQKLIPLVNEQFAPPVDMTGRLGQIIGTLASRIRYR